MLRLVAAGAPAFFLRLLGTVVTFEIVAVVVILIVKLFALERSTAQLLSVVGPGACQGLVVVGGLFWFLGALMLSVQRRCLARFYSALHNGV